MSGVDFTTIKNAIQAWVVAGSGLAGNHVVWGSLRDSRGNPVPRPSGMFISLQIAGLRSPGFDDANTYTEASNVLSQTLQGPRVLVLFMQVFQGSPTGGSDIGALSLLNDLLAAVARDDIAQALQLAKVSIGSYDDAQYVPGAYNDAKQELRAFTTVRLHVRSRIVFTQPVGTGWISNVNATANVTTEKGVEVVTVSVSDT